MNQLSNRDIIDLWRDQPAPFLPILHAFHQRDGYLSDEALRFISEALRHPLADLYGTVTFYHHFSCSPGGHHERRICTGPICSLRGAKELLALGASANVKGMPCSGRCDAPIPALEGNQTLVARNGIFAHEPSPMPAPNPGGLEECVFRNIREPNQASLVGYQSRRGYEALKSALDQTPDHVIATLTASGLAGRGGAGFPTGRKWQAVAQAEGFPKTIVCNADEGEPGCFKDRAVMDYDPHALIEGMVLAAYATGASQGFIYLRYEYPETEHILAQALAEAEAAGFLGNNICGKDGFHFALYLRRGAGAYICGEEGSLLNSLEGKHPFPRNRPPFPVTHGFENRPTVVNNVETLASAAKILCYGAEWYRNLGMNGQAGSKLISLSGDVLRPGNYEVPLGLPLQTLLHEWAGGPLPGRTIQAVTMAGLSGGFLAGKDLEVSLDEPSIRACGSFLGAGGIMVFDDSRDIMGVAAEAMAFFAHESCGKCFPCRIGTQRLTERLGLQAGPATINEWRTEVEEIGQVMAKLSACGLGVAAPLIATSLLKYFPELVKAAVEAPTSCSG